MKDKLKLCITLVLLVVPWFVGILCFCCIAAESLAGWFGNPFVAETGKINTRVLNENVPKNLRYHLWSLGCGSIIYDYDGNILKKGPPCKDGEN